jgi:nicotinamide mononucleotide transporter
VSGSLATQWLAARKRVENWVCWIVLDVVYVGMFVHKQLYLTAVLYAMFTLLAVRGHRAWTASMRGVSS